MTAPTAQDAARAQRALAKLLLAREAAKMCFTCLTAAYNEGLRIDHAGEVGTQFTRIHDADEKIGKVCADLRQRFGLEAHG